MILSEACFICFGVQALSSECQGPYVMLKLANKTRMIMKTLQGAMWEVFWNSDYTWFCLSCNHILPNWADRKYLHVIHWRLWNESFILGFLLFFFIKILSLVMYFPWGLVVLYWTRRKWLYVTPLQFWCNTFCQIVLPSHIIHHGNIIMLNHAYLCQVALVR